MLLKDIETPATHGVFRALGQGAVLAAWTGRLGDGERVVPDAGAAKLGRVQVTVAAPAADDGTRTFVAFRFASAPDAAAPLVVRDRTGQVLALLAPGEAPAGLERTGNATFNLLWTYLWMPCVTLPFDRGPKGLPVGIQLVGRQHEDARLLDVAGWVQGALT